MRRRDFIRLAGAAVIPPSLARARAPKMWRIAVLHSGLSDPQRQAILDGLADNGYVDGKNVALEFFNAPTLTDLPSYAGRAVAGKPDLIITSTSPPALAVKSLTTTIPIVMTNLQDPVAIGAVASYARPGGNLTGFMQAGPQFAGSLFGLIDEVLPSVTRVALLGVPADPVYSVMFAQYLAAAKPLNIETIAIGVIDGEDLAPLLDRAVASGAKAIHAIPAGVYLALNYPTLARLALNRGLPAFVTNASAVASGFLLSYGADSAGLTRRAMSYVDAILKGVKPTDLPIQQPTTFELAINMKTAKALGITFPPSVLLRATQVIE